MLVDALLAERPASVAFGIALGLGLGYALLLFGSAGAAFWALPTGLSGGAEDIRNTLAGYWWFVQDAWRWPLLAVGQPNWPHGANAELFDVVPIAAIAGKLLRTGFGWEVNPYPGWVVLCLTLNAIALTALVRALGQRSVVGAVLAGAFGAMAPVVQFRFGHLALMAHWLPIFALAFYVRGKRNPIAGLSLLACCVHLYLYVMTAAIGAACVLQAMLDRRLAPWRGALALAVLLAAGVVPLWAFGLFDGWNLAAVPGDFTRYSMNLLSPFWPQMSGVFGWTGIYWLTRGSVGAHAGQYEGFNYLGAGALLLIALALLAERRRLMAALSRHLVLVFVFVLLTAWALSNEIYAGPYLLAAYTPPRLLAGTVLSWFCSSGRFFWPVGWFLVGLGIARGLALFRPAPALAIAAVALLLQWTDVAPLRSAIGRVLTTPPVSAFGPAETAHRVAAAIASAGIVAVEPALFCGSTDYASPLNAAAMEVELMAARANARMHAVYLSRMQPDCSPPSAFGVLVTLKDFPMPISATGPCFDTAIARVCSGVKP